jgi:hypothetical protein
MRAKVQRAVEPAIHRFQTQRNVFRRRLFQERILPEGGRRPCSTLGVEGAVEYPHVVCGGSWGWVSHRGTM